MGNNSIQRKRTFVSKESDASYFIRTKREYTEKTHKSMQKVYICMTRHIQERAGHVELSYVFPPEIGYFEDGRQTGLTSQSGAGGKAMCVALPVQNGGSVGLFKVEPLLEREPTGNVMSALHEDGEDGGVYSLCCKVIWCFFPSQ